MEDLLPYDAPLTSDSESEEESVHDTVPIITDQPTLGGSVAHTLADATKELYIQLEQRITELERLVYAKLAEPHPVVPQPPADSEPEQQWISCRVRRTKDDQRDTRPTTVVPDF
jgi:hypothetical protein